MWYPSIGIHANNGKPNICYCLCFCCFSNCCLVKLLAHVLLLNGVCKSFIILVFGLACFNGVEGKLQLSNFSYLMEACLRRALVNFSPSIPSCKRFKSPSTCERIPTINRWGTKEEDEIH